MLKSFAVLLNDQADKTQRGREAKLMRKAQREFLFNDTTHKRYVSILSQSQLAITQIVAAP